MKVVCLCKIALLVVFSITITPISSYGQSATVDEIRAVASLCASRTSTRMAGELDASLARLFGKQVGVKGEVDLSKTNVFDEMETDEGKMHLSDNFLRCIEMATRLLGDVPREAPLGSADATPYLAAPHIPVKSGQRFAMKVGDSRYLQDAGANISLPVEDKMYGSNPVFEPRITISREGRDSHETLSLGESHSIRNTRCFILYYARSKDGVYSFQFECSAPR